MPREDSDRVSLLPRVSDLLSLHEMNPSRYPHLLESIPSGTSSGEEWFDILFAFPEELLELAAPGVLLKNGTRMRSGDFLGALTCAAHGITAGAGGHGLPFRSGWFLYISYDFASLIEPRLPLPHTLARPLAFAERFRSAIIRDRRSGETYFAAAREVGKERIEQVIVDIRRAHDTPLVKLSATTVEEEPEERFLEGVRRIQEYIGAGDVFQVNLSRQWQIEVDHPASPAQIYARLRASNPAPFAGLARLPHGGSIISSSPERLACVRGETITTEPIAGTFARATIDADAATVAALTAHPKERAEHVMLVDLARNDLGRVCRPGSVTVEQLMQVRSYRYVHHLVSRVKGALLPDTGPGAILSAVFPGGTITGCPKLRSMEIIHELEQTGRGAYTGSIGYLSHDGDLDINILIRTLVYESGKITLRAGAGIVADSVPARELAETRAKARGLLAAIGI
ncbi:MAG: aminodeoxychorismate synthase component I [Acidiferrobacteraceae bacterium]